MRSCFELHPQAAIKLTKTFFEDIRGLIHSARATVARGVDVVQVYTNFEIGRRIVQQEQKGKGRAEYGREVIKALAEVLTAEFGMGFSARNLASMKAPRRARKCWTTSRRCYEEGVVDKEAGGNM